MLEKQAFYLRAMFKYLIERGRGETQLCQLLEQDYTKYHKYTFNDNLFIVYQIEKILLVLTVNVCSYMLGFPCLVLIELKPCC